jgi:hypothetical protein
VSPGAAVRRRAVVGPALMVVGAGHVALTPVLFGEATTSLVRGGVVNAVQADPQLATMRALPFWFATTGVGLVVLGAVVTSVERLEAPLPRSLPWLLAGIGGWGIVFLPKSPFWALVALGVVAEVRRRQLALIVDQVGR